MRSVVNEVLNKSRPMRGADKLLFWALVLALVCAPLPLASNRAWAMASLEIGIDLIGIAWRGL